MGHPDGGAKRPVKLVGDLLAAGNTPEQVLECLEDNIT